MWSPRRHRLAAETEAQAPASDPDPCRRTRGQKVGGQFDVAWASLSTRVLSFVMHQTPLAEALTLESIQRLPKTDLHVHLDGSLRLDDDPGARRAREGRAARGRSGATSGRDASWRELRDARRIPQGVRHDPASDADRRSRCGESPTSSPKMQPARTSATWRSAMRPCFTLAAASI